MVVNGLTNCEHVDEPHHVMNAHRGPTATWDACMCTRAAAQESFKHALRCDIAMVLLMEQSSAMRCSSATQCVQCAHVRSAFCAKPMLRYFARNAQCAKWFMRNALLCVACCVRDTLKISAFTRVLRISRYFCAAHIAWTGTCYATLAAMRNAQRTGVRSAFGAALHVAQCAAG